MKIVMKELGEWLEISNKSMYISRGGAVTITEKDLTVRTFKSLEDVYEFYRKDVHGEEKK